VIRRELAAAEDMRVEVRRPNGGNPKLEVRSAKQIRITEMEENSKGVKREMAAGRFAGAGFPALHFSSFGIVSDFEIRISNLTQGFGFRYSSFEFLACYQHEERLRAHLRVRAVASVREE
jgi:hypothetical protein